MEFYLFVTFLIGCFVSRMLIPRIVVISNKKRLFDEPNGRSSHTQPVPRLGGVSFLPALALAVMLVSGLRILTGDFLPGDQMLQLSAESLFLCSGLMVMYVVGVADDLRGVSFRHKFLYQILAASFMILGGVYVDDFHGMFGIHAIPMAVSCAVTILLVVFVINAINLIDGVDGLASGLSAVPLFLFGLWFWNVGMTLYSMVAFGMLGTLIPFFFYNVFGKRHKLFMGDTGSLIIGYLIAFLSAKFCMLNVDPGAYHVHGAPVIILSLLFIPLFDACRVFLVRALKGRSPFMPDRNHIHHKFLDLGFSHRQTMCSLIISAFAIVGVNLWMLPHVGLNKMFFIDILGWGILTQLLHRLGLRLKQKKMIREISKCSMRP